MLFATIPPPGMLNGWLCLIVSLVASAVVARLAVHVSMLVGCLFGLSHTFVCVM